MNDSELREIPFEKETIFEGHPAGGSDAAFFPFSVPRFLNFSIDFLSYSGVSITQLPHLVNNNYRYLFNFLKKVKAGKNDAHKYKDRRCTCFLLTL